MPTPKERELSRRRNQRWRAKASNPNAQNILRYALRKLGATLADYHALLAQQEGRCAICRGGSFVIRGGKGYWSRLAIDHDHQTNKLRGLLCNNCNNGLGRFQDSVLLLEQAARYLRSPATWSVREG